MTFKDKNQKKNEQQEFSRTSRQWIIHPKYNQATGNNYDLCLVKLDQSLNLITGTSAKMIFLCICWSIFQYQLSEKQLLHY